MHPIEKPILTLAHSADADDVFMWWPITGKVVPKSPHRRISPPAIETGRFAYRALPEDIQQLNKRAIEQADLEITAVSFAAYARCCDRYIATSCGSSFGEGYGPKIVMRAERACGSLDQLAAQPLKIAVPGLATTAYLVLSVLAGKQSRLVAVEKPFDTIIDAVSSGEVDAGLVIHEGQLMFADNGLRLVADLGQEWCRRTGGPLPLGANVVRRDLENTFGEGTLKHIAQTLRDSIDYSLKHREESLDYAATFSPLKSRSDLNRYIDMYVSRWTVDAGEQGRVAIRNLFEQGRKVGILPDLGGMNDILVP